MTLADRRIAFVGAGNMAEAMIRGLLSDGTKPEQITASSPREERLEELRKEYAIQCFSRNVEAIHDADVVVLAVKPQILTDVMRELSSSLAAHCLVISVAAGVPIDFIRSHLHRRVSRAMPNIPAIVRQGATAVCFSQDCEDADRAAVMAVFGAVGMVTPVAENLLDAVTGLSGSGPAFIFTIIEALADAGVKVGLPRRQAQALAAQTVLGSAQLLLDSGEHPGVLKDQVTSPGGTAIAGLHTLEQGGLRTTLINAVQAATERARELGRQQAGHAASESGDD